MRKSALNINIIMLQNVNVLNRVALKSCIQIFGQKNESELREDIFYHVTCCAYLEHRTCYNVEWILS